MKKRIFYFIFFLFLMPALFFGEKADATQVYVGVQISSAASPAGNWCLPAESKMAIIKAESCQYNADYFSANYNEDPDNVCQYDSYCGQGFCLTPTAIVTTSPTCPGETIWSGLLDLTEPSYKAYLYVPNFCPGYESSGICWVSAINQSCNEICPNYSLTPTTYNSAGATCYNYQGTMDYSTYPYQYNCSVIEKLKGSPCASCINTTNYSYYSVSSNNCYRNSSGYNFALGTCDWKDPDAGRVCACQMPSSSAATGFLFSFNP